MLEHQVRFKHVLIALAVVVAYKAYTAYLLVYKMSDFLSQMVQR